MSPGCGFVLGPARCRTALRPFDDPHVVAQDDGHSRHWHPVLAKRVVRVGQPHQLPKHGLAAARQGQTAYRSYVLRHGTLKQGVSHAPAASAPRRGRREIEEGRIRMRSRVRRSRHASSPRARRDGSEWPHQPRVSTACATWRGPGSAPSGRTLPSQYSCGRRRHWRKSAVK